MALTGDIGLAACALIGPDFRLGMAVVLHQRNMAGAYLCAAAAFDAVEQLVVLRLVELLRFGVPVKLLRQQPRRADISAGAAADAGHRWSVGAEVLRAQRQNTVGRLDDRHLGARQRKAHHRSAHDQAGIGVDQPARLFQQLADGRADVHAQVAGLGDAGAGDRDHALRQRAALHHRLPNRQRRAGVVADDADIQRQTVAGDFASRQRLN